MSEILVGAVEETSQSLGLNAMFMGVVVVAIVGNAAEHSTAVLMALKNQMDLAVGIAFGSALQVALFVAPMVMFASYFRQTPMDLVFSTMEVLAIILAVAIARMVAEDGESTWLEGAMLLMVYGILAVAFYYMPEVAAPVRAEADAKTACLAPFSPPHPNSCFEQRRDRRWIDASVSFHDRRMIGWSSSAK